MQTAPAARPLPWTCHWTHISGPVQNGRQSRTRVWICEYPYRTMRASGPCGDCDACEIVRGVEVLNNPPSTTDS